MGCADRLWKNFGIPASNFLEDSSFASCGASNCGCSNPRVRNAGKALGYLKNVSRLMFGPPREPGLNSTAMAHFLCYADTVS